MEAISASVQPASARRVVEKRQAREVIAFAGVVPAAFATADEDAAVMAGRGLGDLNVDGIVMKGDLTRDSDAASVISQVKAAFLPAHEVRKLAKPGACSPMEGFFELG